MYSGLAYSNHKNGNLKFVGRIEKGLKEGEWRYFDIQGVLDSKTHLHQGHREGKEISYFQNGEISEELYYKNGKPNGKYELWFSSGELKISGTYLDGLKTGEWREYDMNSDVVKVELYDNDSLQNVQYINKNKPSR